MAIEEVFFRGMGMTVVTGSRYLSRFIEDREAKDTCLVEKVQGWAESGEDNARGSPQAPAVRL